MQELAIMYQGKVASFFTDLSLRYQAYGNYSSKKGRCISYLLLHDSITTDFAT